MSEQVSNDTIEKIVIIKKLLTEPDILINTNMLCGSIYKEPDMLDLLAAECNGHIFKCVIHEPSGGIHMICRSCGKKLLSFNILEYK